MNSRTLALMLTVLGGGVMFFLAAEQTAVLPALAGALLAVAAIWLASGRMRVVLAAVSSIAWFVALVLSVFGSVYAVAGCLIGLAGAVLTLWRGHPWPGFSARYARASDIAEDQMISPRQFWESLDRGLDPTDPKKRKDSD